MIVARGLVKRFGDFVAVDGIDVEVQRGEAFGFLGPNGAGKSSTMRMIGCVSAGHRRHAAGARARPGRRRRPRSGPGSASCPQEDTLDVELTVRENLLVYGRYFGLPRAEVGRAGRRAARLRPADGAGDSKVEPLSGGMKRRLTIARSLINDPDMLLLDEPTTGLDPQARHVLWDRLFRLKQQGVTLVLTTHYMDEAEQLCDRLVVMDGGRIAAEGSPAGLIREWSTREVVELRFPPATTSPRARRSRRWWTLPAAPAALVPGRGAARPACCSTPTTATRPWPRCTGAGSQPAVGRSSAAARWRTSSSG